MSIESLYDTLQEEALPGVWSKGVALARNRSFAVDRLTSAEVIVRVLVTDRPVKPKVTLWPDEDDSFCDCGERIEPCAHIVAAIVALKSGTLHALADPNAPKLDSAEDGENPKRPTPKTPDQGSTALGSVASGPPRIAYRLSEAGDRLTVQRTLVRAGAETPLRGSLVSFLGGIQSGRISGPVPAPTQEDLLLDRILTPSSNELGISSPSAKDAGAILRALESAPIVTWMGKPIVVNHRGIRAKARVYRGGRGWILEWHRPEGLLQVLSNGFALTSDTLTHFDSPSLQQRTEYSESEISRLVGEIIPSIQASVELETLPAEIPRLIEGLKPGVLFHLEAHEGAVLTVLPRIVYGDPPVAEALGAELTRLDLNVVVSRDLPAERALIRQLQTELHLRPGSASRFEGSQAVQIRSRLQALESGEWRISGSGSGRFADTGTLLPRLRATPDGLGLSIEFEVDRSQHRASAESVLKAWSEGGQFAPLLGGGWGRLPHDWLSQYGARIQALLAARNPRDSKLPPAQRIELAALLTETGEKLPESLRSLEAQLTQHQGIPHATLPSDLKAELRNYQRTGVDWLSLLIKSGMGALLADDMGLGKTLQALCVLPEKGQGNCIVICPTSVLHSWQEQLKRFRPGLRIHTYFGQTRKLPDLGTFDVLLTTYGIARLDEAILCRLHWKIALIDEAQTIRNPRSQVAQAIHALASKADGRIALSGTPIENRLTDLWSQFAFLNPGLLGAESDFETAANQNIQAARRRIHPFLLRRLKKQVAAELPPRTETVLQCELEPEERRTYDAILSATRAQVLSELDQGQGVLGALEALLRLRQACCSLALVPGASTDSVAAQPSSKLRLLTDALTASVEAGHRALVFSQWTSFLDLIEPELKRAGLSFSRLDGATRDRASVVEEFQTDTGPSVMLLSLKAGGVGLTLTAADHVFITDPWWNPAAENQAADRAHRIGQTQPVLIHRIVARDTIEERVLALQEQKKQLAQSLIGKGPDSAQTPLEEPMASSLTQDDIRALLEG